MTSQRVVVRVHFFMEMYSRLLTALPEIFRNIAFDKYDAQCLASLFFLMSDNYKAWRVDAGHYTNDPKKAGLTIAAIMAIRPLRAAGPDESDLRRFYLNPVFGLACATAILKRPIYLGLDVDKVQLYAWLDTLRFPSTEPFINDADAMSPNLGEIKVNLSYSEVSQIDIIAQKMADAARYYDLEAQIYNTSHDP